MSIRWGLKLLAAALFAVSLLLPRPAPSMAASGDLPSMLLTLDGIEGGYAEAPYKGAIVVASFAHEEAGQDIQLVKAVDKSSLPLLQALASGRAIRDGYLYFQNDNAKKSFTYMIVHLAGVQVTGYQLSASDAGPMETITLRANDLLYKYASLNPDGSPGPVQTWPDDVAVKTTYHFDPIYAATAKGYRYIAGFKVTLEAQPASGVGRTQYRINGGDWTDYAGPFDIYAEDTHTLEYYSTGRDGSAEKVNTMDFDNGVFTGSGNVSGSGSGSGSGSP